jgi:diguanylate cyclase
MMGQHDAAFNPLTFTVCYEHASGINTPLSAAIEQATQGGAHLNDAMIEALYHAHVIEGDPVTMQRITEDLQRMMGGMVDSATRTGSQAELFGNQLQDLTQALVANNEAAMNSLVSEAIAGTAQMQSSAHELEQQVKASRLEIERLQGELVRARDEVVLDPLTRLLNRKGFDDRLSRMIQEPPAQGMTHCLAMLDIDHFKKVNDTHGHVMGDRVIQALGEVLRTCVSDKLHSVARYGGEEFAILMPHTTLEAAIQLAEFVRQKTRSMKIRDRRTQEVVLTVSISGGVAALQQTDDGTTLVSRADAALYKSKQNGRDRITPA